MDLTQTKDQNLRTASNSSTEPDWMKPFREVVLSVKMGLFFSTHEDMKISWYEDIMTCRLQECIVCIRLFRLTNGALPNIATLFFSHSGGRPLWIWNDIHPNLTWHLPQIVPEAACHQISQRERHNRPFRASSWSLALFRVTFFILASRPCR